MKHTNCLNCNKELTDKYCSRCGQKADTHRISFKNFIFHDVLHGTFHIDKGMLFTAKQALMRPGQAALDYIWGKRKRYYNVFYLILIVIGLIIFFRHFSEELVLMQGGQVAPDKVYLNEASRKIDEIFSQKSKIIVFLFVPFAALNSFLLFRRKKLNLSEHAVIAGMILLGFLLTSLFGNLFFYLDFIVAFSPTFSDVISWTVVILIILQIGYGYFNAFGKDYSTLQIILRIVLFFALTILEVLILFIIMVGFATNWKFGQITVTPFG